MATYLLFQTSISYRHVIMKPIDKIMILSTDQNKSQQRQLLMAEITTLATQRVQQEHPKVVKVTEDNFWSLPFDYNNYSQIFRNKCEYVSSFTHENIEKYDMQELKSLFSCNILSPNDDFRCEDIEHDSKDKELKSLTFTTDATPSVLNLRCDEMMPVNDFFYIKINHLSTNCKILSPEYF